MNTLDITKILVDKKLIGKGTKISARITISAFGNIPVKQERECLISDIKSDGFETIFDNKKYHADFDQITAIEGMDVARFAQAYRIKPKKS